MSASPAEETSIGTVERLAALARISIPDNRKEALAAEFESVLAYIGQLDELSLSVKENSDGTPVLPPLHNVFRDDADPYAPGTWTKEIIDAFPAKAGNTLSVKKILSHD